MRPGENGVADSRTDQGSSMEMMEVSEMDTSRNQDQMTLGLFFFFFSFLVPLFPNFTYNFHHIPK